MFGPLAPQEAVHGLYGDDVLHSYLTEFVMQ